MVMKLKPAACYLSVLVRMSFCEKHICDFSIRLLSTAAGLGSLFAAFTYFC